jgi:radical SAM superfamily enzyme YgiQ (UPF0313 family)
MSKILLIKPRFFNLEFVLITQPLGLMYISASLKEAGHEVKIHDCASDHNNHHLLTKIIQEWKPNFIGISIIITELEQTKIIMGMIRTAVPDVPVIFGGPWPSANPENAIKILGADIVVIGEGEKVFVNLIEALNKRHPIEGLPGIASMANGQIKINPSVPLSEDEMDRLPSPSWELIDHELYAKNHSAAIVGHRVYMSVVTSRGCPYNCAYCHQTMGKVYRRRSAGSVLSEIEKLHFEYGFEEIEIIDDCFNVDRTRMRAILEGIRDRIGKIKLHFPNIRADILEPEDLMLFKQAGTVSAGFAIETSSIRLQKMICKDLNIEKAVQAINSAVRLGIYSLGYFMIGFPTETYEEASGTVDFAVSSSLHRALFYIPIPFAGTKLADMVSECIKNRNDGGVLNKSTYLNSNLNISAMSDRELQKIVQSAHRRFYLNPRRIIKLILTHPKAISLPHYAFLVVLRSMPKRRN